METKKKRGRPATGRSQARKHLDYQIAYCYDSLRIQGIPEEAAIEELMRQKWQVIPGPLKPITLGEESIRAAIKESRSFMMTIDTFTYSSRLTIHPFWGKLFERDKLTGKVSPVSTNRLLIDFVKNCSSIRVRKKLPHTSKRQAIN